MYVTSRTLAALAKEGIAYHKLGKLEYMIIIIIIKRCVTVISFLVAYVNRYGVPIYALICTSAVSLVCFLTSFIPGSALFLVLCDLGGIAGLVSISIESL
jgi:lysine-specific permease